MTGEPEQPCARKRPRFISAEEFAEETGLSIHSVRALVAQKRLAAMKTTPGRGGRVLILASELDAWEEQARAWKSPPVTPDELPAPDEFDGETEEPTPAKKTARKPPAKKTTQKRTPRKRS